MKKFFMVVATISTLLTAEAQTPTKTTKTSSQIWTQYFLTARLNKHWSAYFDGGIRFSEFFQATSQVLVRPGVTYHINSNLSFTAGGAYFAHYPAFSGYEEVRPEKRLWQQVAITGKLGKVNINHRYRLEQRWQKRMSKGYQTDDWNYNFRMRYQINMTYPLKGDKLAKGVPYVQVYDELMINFGKEIMYNTFDQNRLYVGMGYSVTDQLSVTLGYQWIYGQKKTGYQFDSVNCIRLTIVQQLDFRKKEENK